MHSHSELDKWKVNWAIDITCVTNSLSCQDVIRLLPGSSLRWKKRGAALWTRPATQQAIDVSIHHLFDVTLDI